MIRIKFLTGMELQSKKPLVKVINMEMELP